MQGRKCHFSPWGAAWGTERFPAESRPERGRRENYGALWQSVAKMMKERRRKIAKCRSGMGRLQMQRKKTPAGGVFGRKTALRQYVCLWWTGAGFGEIPTEKPVETGRNRSQNIKLWEMTKNALRLADGFVQTNEFAIYNRKVAKRS